MNESAATINRISDNLQDLAGPKTNGYGPTPIPNDIDTKISELIIDYLGLNQNNRDQIKVRVKGDDLKFVFLAFAERMASYAVRTASRKVLINAMIAMFLQAGIGDVREDLMVLTLIHAAALKLGLDPRTIFLESAEKFGVKDTSGLEDFLDREDEDKSIECMGYIEGADSDGFRFIRTW